MEERVLVVKFGYKGKAYAGYAKQKHAPSVQAELERALSTYFRREIDTVCAGRTDTGVHARAQHASFELRDEDDFDAREPYRIKRALDALLPDDIRVSQLYLAQKDFSARFSALKRIYKYRISTSIVHPLFTQDYVWDLATELNVDAMKEASNYFIGEHDFKSFCKAVSAVDKPTHRFVESVSFSYEEAFSEEHLVIQVSGNAFLHSMVRTMVGSLVEVGLNKKNPSWIKEVLAAQDRQAAGQNAPAKGLCLDQVIYSKDALKRII